MMAIKPTKLELSSNGLEADGVCCQALAEKIEQLLVDADVSVTVGTAILLHVAAGQGADIDFAKGTPGLWLSMCGDVAGWLYSQHLEANVELAKLASSAVH